MRTIDVMGGKNMGAHDVRAGAAQAVSELGPQRNS